MTPAASGFRVPTLTDQFQNNLASQELDKSTTPFVLSILDTLSPPNNQIVILKCSFLDVSSDEKLEGHSRHCWCKLGKEQEEMEAERKMLHYFTWMAQSQSKLLTVLKVWVLSRSSSVQEPANTESQLSFHT